MIKEKFFSGPLNFYGLSIAASWAGVGSLLNTITMAKDFGIFPALIWASANILSCVIFGIAINKLPTLRDVMEIKAVRYVITIMGIFHIWLSMNGIREVFSNTYIGVSGGTTVAYSISIAFIFVLLWRGMLRNILTDSASWLMVYGLIAFVTLTAFLSSGGQFNHLPLGNDSENLIAGLYKGFLLLPGPFTYLYFYELLKYNDSKATTKVDMTQAFMRGGIFFGVYVLFALSLAFVDFPPELNLIKAVLISLVAVSTLSTFLFSIYLVFGRGIGVCIDTVAVLFWSDFMNLGVMGVWQLVASIRSYLVGGIILAALMLAWRKRNDTSAGT